MKYIKEHKMPYQLNLNKQNKIIFIYLLYYPFIYLFRSHLDIILDIT